MPSVFSRNVVPTPSCQWPALSEAICCGIWRIAAMIRPHVSSAAAKHGTPACWLEETTMPCRNAGLDIDMRIDAALADEAQLRQPYNQRRADRGALADQHQRLDVGKPRRERVGVLDVVVPDRDVVPGELR